MSANSLTGLQVGQNLDFSSTRFGSDGLLDRADYSEVIHGLAGGGFRGEVILLPDSVLKTGVTTPTKKLLRELNGSLPDFHPAGSCIYATHDYIATKALHEVVSAVGEGEIIMPEPIGFVDLGHNGFAQQIERVDGRIVSFLDHDTENRKVEAARHFIWEVIGKEFGFEHSAQVHPENPFAKPNLWIGENGKVIWLDFLAAFPLKGRAWPNPKKYEFHVDAQKVFGHERPMDGINTEMFYSAMLKHRSRFSNEQIQKLEKLMPIYESISAELRKEKASRGANGSLSRSVAQLSKSSFRAGSDMAMKLVPPVVTDRSEKARSRPLPPNEKSVTRTVLSKTLLSGVASARKHGLVSQKDYESSLGFLSPKDARLFTTMQLGFFMMSRVSDVVSLPFYAFAATSENPVKNLLLTGLVHQVGPNILRGITTIIVGKRSGKNLNRMAAQSCIPVFGTYLSIPLQITREYGEHGDLIKHYGRRSMAAKLSKLKPSGGWGSDAEMDVWNAAKNSTGNLHRMLRKIGALANFAQNRNQNSLDLLHTV